MTTGPARRRVGQNAQGVQLFPEDLWINTAVYLRAITYDHERLGLQDDIPMSIQTRLRELGMLDAFFTERGTWVEKLADLDETIREMRKLLYHTL